jgi:M6 family metalloprotease-like protein
MIRTEGGMNMPSQRLCNALLSSMVTALVLGGALLTGCSSSSHPGGPGGSGGAAGGGGTSSVTGTGGRGTGGTATGGSATDTGTGGGGGTATGGSATDAGTGGSGGTSTGGSGGTAADGGGDASPEAGAPVHEGWPTYEQAEAAPLSTPLLVILLDFSDSDIASFLPNPDVAWSTLMFGHNQGQGNHFWYEVTAGKLQLLKAHESYGQADDGVIRVKLSESKPTSGTYVVEDQPWIPEALDQAAQYVRFADYDLDHNGSLSNRELSVMFVMNLENINTANAGAEANIAIDHPIAGTGVTLEKFLRLVHRYASIGVPCHELGHHILKLSHTPSPTIHDLMGLGAYAEDPVLTTLYSSTDHYATRPTGPTAMGRVMGGLVTPTSITETTLGVKLYSPQSVNYNVIKLPIVEGFLFLENRTAEGYDRSVPFCNGHTGGMFATDNAQYLFPLDIPGIKSHNPAVAYEGTGDDTICNYYTLKGYNDTFTIGQYTISNVSAPGPVMTLDITRNDTTSVIDNYKYEYWINDPNRSGYRLRHFVPAPAGATTDIDYTTFPSGTDPTGYFTMNLIAYYNTGEIRSVNADATWTSTSSYVKAQNIGNFQNPGTSHGDALIQLQIDTTATRTPTAVINISHGSFGTSMRLINVP